MRAEQPTRPGGTITIGGELQVGRIGYGSMRLTGPQIWGDYADHQGAIAILRDVVASGVNFIDTADVYGPHSVELLIKEALHPYPDDLVIATKGGFVRGGYDYSTLGAVGNPNYLRQSAQMSARRLGLERIDLYYLHSGRATDAPFETQIQTLAALRQEGLIRHIGLSNITLDQYRRATEIAEIAAVTAHYNPTVRINAGLLTATRADGVVFSPWHPITTTEGLHADAVAAVTAPIAARHGLTDRQVALAWQLQHAPQTLPVVGTTNIAHLHQNLEAARVALSAEEVAAITAAAPDH